MSKNLVETFMNTVRANHAKDIEISRKYKAQDVVSFLRYARDKGITVASNKGEAVSVSDLLKFAETLPPDKTSKLFKTSLFMIIINAIENRSKASANTTSSKTEDLNKHADEPSNMADQKIQFKLEYLERKLENIAQSNRILLELIAAQHVLIKALVKDVPSSKAVKQQVSKIIDTFAYDTKYEIPFDELRGLSFHYSYDEDFLNSIKKLTKQMF